MPGGGVGIDALYLPLTTTSLVLVKLIDIFFSSPFPDGISLLRSTIIVDGPIGT